MLAWRRRHQRAAIGDLCIAGGMLSASLYSVVAKKLRQTAPTLSSTTLQQFSASTLVLLSVAGLRWIAPLPQHFQPIAAKPQYWLAAAVTAWAASALSFLLYNRTISMVGRRVGRDRSQSHDRSSAC